ncbi:hypothetical protein D0Q02_29875 [Micromonospora craniellae]|uniref:Uncharacterized protein n=1 Tax=Micromonospora craniellae TaxID=2294034 RepID=A0A372FR91_9ACTN|nr:hypothetical protein D0Q02_29875 [Micromonospora craniellae]
MKLPPSTRQSRTPERSAGVQSSTLLLLAAQGEIPGFDAAIFADTSALSSPAWTWSQRGHVADRATKHCKPET